MVTLEVKGGSASERLIVLHPYTATLIVYQDHDVRTPAVKLRDMDGKGICWGDFDQEE